jgi:putative heme-binding domain-containing protein
MKFYHLLLLAFATITHAIEPWADDRLPVKDGVALWLDASRVPKARAAMRLPLFRDQGLDMWQDGSGARRSVRQMELTRRPLLEESVGGSAIKFDGKDDCFSGQGPIRAGSVTLFAVAAPLTNSGGYRALVSFAEEGLNDYRTGLNVDFGPQSGATLHSINVEGAGVTNGVQNLLKTQFDLGTFHVVSVVADKTEVRLRVDGQAEGARPRNDAALAMVQSLIGARSYSNSGSPPQPSGFFHGSIAEVLLYDRVLNTDEQTRVERYLKDKHSGLQITRPLAGAKPLKRVEKPALVQFLAPGFEVMEAPLKPLASSDLKQGVPPGFPNVNFLRYRHDGMLVAGGYNGKIYLLRDTDGDGIEDSASLFWESEGIRVVMGMAVTPRGDPRGDGVLVATLGRVVFIPDKNDDGKGDAEIVVAEGWAPPQRIAGGASDCLGLTLDRDGSVWFGLGTKNMNSPYVPDDGGKMTYNVEDERGSIYRVSPDFKTREKICSGIRYPVGFAFNAAGDLFVTDQEGATWLPNGNPFDEFLHIEKGRHYGFPPRHPQHLPAVNDEPSVFDFEPQHQSTCGFFFNDGKVIFGRDWWKGDAFICGESRGKLYRLKQFKTAAGYVAQTQLMASLSMLPIDCVLSPRGDLVVTCHSGGPDWGSGPKGSGKIFHIRASKEPLPVLAWAAAPGEWRIAFDQPLKPENLRELTKSADITAGRYVFAADRYETVRPGYQSVRDQLAAPRFDVPVIGSSVSPDGRTLTLRTAPRLQAENIAITVPTGHETPVDVQTSLHGVSAVWEGSNGTKWSGWLPHLDLAVARSFTQASAEHDALWPMLQKAGKLTLRGQLDLWHLLRPEVQPGADPGYQYAPETVNLVFTAKSAFKLTAAGKTHASAEKNGHHEATVIFESKEADQWLPFEMTTECVAPEISLHWFTHEDARPRALPLRRVLLPWARSASAPVLAESKHDLPELRGGDWARGKALFHGKAACFSCHATADAAGPPKLGPNLANLIHRDYESVLRDIREPGAAINPEHIGYTVETTDGATLAAVLSGEQDGVMKFVDVTGARDLPRTKLKSMQALPVSLMPPGLWDMLNADERRDLMTFLLTTPPVEKADPTRDEHLIRVTILTGLDGPFHDWRKTSAALKQELERDSRMNVRIVTDPEFLATAALFQTDVLVQHYVNWQRPGLSETAKTNLLKFVNDGGGLAVMHFANGAFSDWPDYPRLLLRRAWVANQGSGHDNYAPFRVMPTKLTHPITAGLAAFDTTDELYCRQIPSGDAPDVEPLITATCKTTGKDEPLAYAFARGKGRVFQSMLGHSDISMHAAGEFHRRGIAWAAGRAAVETPFVPAPLLAEGAPLPRKMSEIKAILGDALTAKPDSQAKPLHIVLCASAKDGDHGGPGAHNYPLWRSRWSRLLGMADGINVEPANIWPSSEQWRTADIIAFNSFNPAWAGERDAAKIKQRGEDMDKFLARGGGIVFIHYAMNAGKNASALAQRLGLAWNRPPAAFRHGASDWVLDKNHPLAAGFDKFQVPDESYWHLTGDLAAAKGNVLATSLEENAPTPQMWTREVGPGRVFVSIPGHYTWTYDDPLYRILILRGLMWTAKQPQDRLAPLSVIGARVE